MDKETFVGDMRGPTDKEIDDACMNFRHDFGLLEKEEADKIRFFAKEWLRAWMHVVFHSLKEQE